MGMHSDWDGDDLGFASQGVNPFAKPMSSVIETICKCGAIAYYDCECKCWDTSSTLEDLRDGNVLEDFFGGVNREFGQLEIEALMKPNICLDTAMGTLQLDLSIHAEELLWLCGQLKKRGERNSFVKPKPH